MKILAFGEILFDVFEGEEKLGGAPFNFCADICKLGSKAFILSSLARDVLGKKACLEAAKLGVDLSFCNVDSAYPTGQCVVAMDQNGEPNYDIKKDCAYDYIAVDKELCEKIEREKFDMLYFGTLAQRNEGSREALRVLLNTCRFGKIFFDVNLRQDYYSVEILESGLFACDILKLNFSECEILCKLGLCNESIGSINNIRNNENIVIFEENLLAICKNLCEKYCIETVIVTLDSKGAFAFNSASGECFLGAAKKAEVVSAVGAGDAFSSCFAFNYLCGANLEDCVNRANVLGGYTVGFLEATPNYGEELIEACTGKQKSCT